MDGVENVADQVTELGEEGLDALAEKVSGILSIGLDEAKEAVEHLSKCGIALGTVLQKVMAEVGVDEEED
jgi:hypothetical protein